MSNGTDQQQYNCALEICCGGADKTKQVKAVAHILHHRLGDGQHTLEQIADAVIASFDLADVGTLKPLKDSIAKFARSAPYEG